jgi:hypothetical protein
MVPEKYPTMRSTSLFESFGKREKLILDWRVFYAMKVLLVWTSQALHAERSGTPV